MFLFTLSWNNSSNRLFNNFSQHSCVASPLLHFFQPFQQTCSWQHLLATFCLSGCFGAVRLTPPKVSFSTGEILPSLRNLNVNCASFFCTCCCPANLARPNPSRKTRDEDSLRSELYIHLARSLQSSISCWQDAALDDVTSTLGRDQFFVYTLRRKPAIIEGWSDFVIFQVSGLVEITHVHTNPGFRGCAFQNFNAIPSSRPPSTCANINMGNSHIVKSRVKNYSTANHMRGSSQCCLIWISQLSAEFLV